MRHVLNHLMSLWRAEDGAQIIEYSLLIGVVALSLTLSLNAMTGDGGGFSQFMTRVVTCLTTPSCT